MRVKITQVYKATRIITIEVEGKDAEEVLSQGEAGTGATPTFGDPRWSTSWELTSEKVEKR